MACIWLTYSWADNESGDVDFIAQELSRFGLKIKLDRWNLQAGTRLWEQIANFIQSESECDAWLIFATQESLSSEPCKEELAYALDRALSARGNKFPIIALFPTSVETNLIPASIKARLHVSVTDPFWKDRIKAAAEQRMPEINPTEISPFYLKVHTQNTRSVIEVRPRAGSWSPFFAAIPKDEKEVVNLSILHGPRDRIPNGGALFNSGSGLSSDGQWWFSFAQNEATPTQSYFIFVNKMPSKVLFGVDGGPNYTISNSPIIK